MSEHYYYLIDNQEHGPFSSGAIKSLISSGQLKGALLRDENPVWRTQREMGFSPYSGMTPAEATSPRDVLQAPLLSSGAQKSDETRKSDESSDQIPTHVRASLKKYQKHTNMTCFECGYSGFMGVKRVVRPWYASWWLVILALIVTAPFGPWAWTTNLAVVLVMLFSGKKVTECPNCGVDLLETEKC